MSKSKSKSKRLLVVCARRYNGHELWTLLGVIQRRGHSFEVVSTDTVIQDEKTFRANYIERTLYEVEPSESENFDGLAVVSGNPIDTRAYWDDKHLLGLMVAFKVRNKVLAGICAGAPALGAVAKGAKISFFPLIESRKHLQKFGAICQEVSITVDVEHRMVTAENQMMSEMWGEEICNLLEGKDPEIHLQKSAFRFSGFQRRFPEGVEEVIDRAYRRKGKRWFDK